jgi:site-specific DNA recombinase
MIAQDGRFAVHAGVDKTLVSGLRAAHRLAAQCGLKDGPAEPQGRPINTYERNLCALAFLAPDIQAAILRGRQPSGLNLKHLLTMAIPFDWAAQRLVLEMPLAAG